MILHLHMADFRFAPSQWETAYFVTTSLIGWAQAWNQTCLKCMYDFPSPLGFKVLVEMWSEAQDLDGVIGPGCSTVCIRTGLLVAAWNLPAVSYSCTSGTLSEKETYPTFTRTVQPLANFAPVLNGFLDTFG